ncbi:hypothetical protein CLIB1444_05S07140 [[Candida] jaroonii]|uniref:Uncharacterized protein n=1 Tax=[Candida] jaroonii TaxID=467808 RepID=A0ACA9Y8B1_9ASCO|nr:hypothetical protein CLIB1444_05S07140 [[Candida] jaroonii]
MKLLKLSEISIRKCVRHSNQMTDVGTIPYHLVRPILMKLNSKQLRLIETNSPHLKPNTDELWKTLIMKDFPSRPNRPLIITSSPMPNKELYDLYENEQENFRKDSTERLKRMTQKLKTEKEENSVIEVEQILRDPVVKGYRGPRNSILNKARKELMGRSLMFPGKKRDTSMIRPIRERRPQQTPVVGGRFSRPTTSPQVHKVVKPAITRPVVNKPVITNPVATINEPTIKPTVKSTVKPTVKPTVNQPQEIDREKIDRMKKKKPSIFMTSPRKRVKPVAPPPKKRPAEPTETPIKRIKSSVFN